MIREQSEQAMQQFMKNVVYIRKYYGFTKKEMAKILQIGIKSLDKIERGILPNRLKVSVLFRMHQCFGVSANDLLETDLATDDRDRPRANARSPLRHPATS